MTVNLQACKLTVVTMKVLILGLLGTSYKGQENTHLLGSSRHLKAHGRAGGYTGYPQIRTPLDHTPSIHKHLMSTYYVPGAKQDGDGLPTYLPAPSPCWEHHHLPRHL